MLMRADSSGAPVRSVTRSSTLENCARSDALGVCGADCAAAGAASARIRKAIATISRPPLRVSRAVQLVSANEVPGVRTDSEREELRGNVQFCHRSTTLFLNNPDPLAR